MEILKDITLLNGDCLELMKNIKDNSIDLICTDLPYGQTARNKWDIIIPFNDYIEVKMGKKYQIMYIDDFLLYSYKTNKLSYLEALDYFNTNKKIGLWTEYNRVIKENGAIILFANGMFTADLMHSNKAMWRYNLIWEKTQPTGFQNANRMPMRNHEDMCMFYKKQPTYNPQKTDGHLRKISTAEHKRNSKQSSNYGEINNHTYDRTERFPKSVWKFSKDTQKCALTPTQKPLALLEEIIKTYTNDGDIVFDSCMGSNPAGRACKNLHRKFIGIEKDEDTFNIAINRVKTA